MSRGSGLRDAIAQQTQGLSELTRACAASQAWNDPQRHDLDRQCLEPLTADANRLVEVLRSAAREFAAAEQMVQR